MNEMFAKRDISQRFQILEHNVAKSCVLLQTEEIMKPSVMESFQETSESEQSCYQRSRDGGSSSQ